MFYKIVLGLLYNDIINHFQPDMTLNLIKILKNLFSVKSGQKV